MTEIKGWTFTGVYPAFYGCSGLSNIIVGKGNPIYDSRNNCNAIIETRTNKLLYACSNTTIPDSVTKIGNWTLNDCCGLTSITIPASVTEIERGNFTDCCGLTNIIVEKGNPIYDSRNNCNAIIETRTNKLLYACSNTNIPDSVTTIESNAFENCRNLTSIILPNSITTIKERTFNRCSRLTCITIPNSVTRIEESAFEGCEGLTSITIPNSVTKIEGLAFRWCSSLTNITIPNSVTDIWESAFWWCTRLQSVILPRSLEDELKGVFTEFSPNAIITYK